MKKIVNKIVSIVVVFSLMISSNYFGVVKAYSGGEGTKENPSEISLIEDSKFKISKTVLEDDNLVVSYKNADEDSYLLVEATKREDLNAIVYSSKVKQKFRLKI